MSHRQTWKLGHELTHNVCNWQRTGPFQPSELRSFINHCDVFRGFMQIFVNIGAPLTRKLGKDQPRVYKDLRDEELKALDSLQTLWEERTSMYVLGLPRSWSTYNTLDVKSCSHQVLRTIVQKQPEG